MTYSISSDEYHKLKAAERTVEDLKKELEKEKKLNAEIKVRFVKCNTCTEDMKQKCLMFSENLCEGDRCEELVDIMSLIDKAENNNAKSNVIELIQDASDDRLENILRKLMDIGVIRSWYYNGKYNAC